MFGIEFSEPKCFVCVRQYWNRMHAVSIDAFVYVSNKTVNIRDAIAETLDSLFSSESVKEPTKKE